MHKTDKEYYESVINFSCPTGGEWISEEGIAARIPCRSPNGDISLATTMVVVKKRVKR